VQQYQYCYNSWGFRDQDFEQYQGQPVNICIGDSVTVNLGGPESHSWCRQLSQYFDIPTLNFGIDDLGCFDVPAVVERTRSTFDVQRIFVLYNLQTTDQEPIHAPLPTYNHNHHTAHKITAFQQYALVPGVYFQFDPPWTFSTQDRRELRRVFPEAHAYLDRANLDVSKLRLCDVLVNQALYSKYQELRGPDWPNFEEFFQQFLTGHDMIKLFTLRSDQRLVDAYLQRDVWPVIQRLILANRDGWHLSHYANGLLAQYFYQQTLTTK
jgi:hypothetical protein